MRQVRRECGAGAPRWGSPEPRSASRGARTLRYCGPAHATGSRDGRQRWSKGHQPGEPVRHAWTGRLVIDQGARLRHGQGGEHRPRAAPDQRVCRRRYTSFHGSRTDARHSAVGCSGGHLCANAVLRDRFSPGGRLEKSPRVSLVLVETLVRHPYTTHVHALETLLLRPAVDSHGQYVANLQARVMRAVVNEDVLERNHLELRKHARW